MPIKKAILAGGCFWCTEAIYKRLQGVVSVLPGYARGTVTSPTYEQVSLGNTDHAEAILIEYDDTLLPYEKILTIFFHTHDPTTPNQQGADIGPQYRSAVFYQTAGEKEIAERIVSELTKEKVYPNNIVTEITAFTNFYPAEDYHRDYYDRNKSQGYCHIVISPKITKLMQEYGSDVKDEFKK